MMMEINANAVSDFLSQHEVAEPIMIKRQGVPHAVMIPMKSSRRCTETAAVRCVSKS